MSHRSRVASAIVAVAASFAVAAPAVAQQGAQQVSFGKLTSALNNVAVQVDRVNALNDLTVEDVQVVNVEDSLNGNRVRALNNALRDADIDALQEFLNDNEIKGLAEQQRCRAQRRRGGQRARRRRGRIFVQ